MNEESLFAGALQRPAGAERQAFLDGACAGNPELRDRLEQLLAADGHSQGILDFEPSEGFPPEPRTGEWSPPDLVTEGPIGPYKLLERIGEGGFGVVYLAEQTEPVRRKVALKILKPGMDTRYVVARFEAERQALAIMDHPNIAKVFDGGATPAGRPFFVMELVKGVPITEYCDQNHLTPRQRLELFVSVCQAVQHAHQKGIIHRDLKPSNVLVSRHDVTPVVKVIDFGIAKALGQSLTDKTLFTGIAQMIGTPLYMSPEQAGMSDLDVDTRGDIYSLGVLLYELLTGTTPFSKERFREAGYDEMRRIIREEEPPRPSTRLSTDTSAPSLAALRHTEPKKLAALLRGELDWVVMKCLEKERSRRYETANGLARDIQRFLADEPVEARPPSAGYKLRKFLRRNRVPVIAASLVLLALAIGVTGTALGLVRANRAAEAEWNAKLEADGRRQEAERNLAFAKKGNEILGSVFAGLHPRQIAESGRPLLDVLRENLSTAVKELEGAAIGDPLEMAKIQYTLGVSLLGLGEVALAVEVLQRSFDARKARLGPDHTNTLITGNDLALAYLGSGQIARAVSLFEKTLEQMKAKLGADHANTVITMGNLALAYELSDRLDLAVPLFEHTLEKYNASLGSDHPYTLMTMGNVAEAYRKNGQPLRAVPLAEKALEKCKARLGAYHPDTLIIANDLAEAYLGAGQFAKAVPLLEETLEKRKANLGLDHPNTLKTMSDLGAAYRYSDQLARALPLLEETLEKMRAKLGPDNHNMFECMSHLASAYREKGQHDRSIPLFEEALEKRKAKLGPDHSDTLRSMNNLAVAYQAKGDLARAVPLFEESLVRRRAKLGGDHLNVLESMNNLAVAYGKSGQHARALPLIEETWEKVRTELGPDHPHTLFTLGNLGIAYANANQVQKAATALAAFINAIRKRAPNDNPKFDGILARMSLDLVSCGQHALAEPLLRECLAIREKTQPDVWTTFNIMSMLGGALLGQRRFSDAEPLLLKGYDGMKQREDTIPKTGGAELRIPEALERLVQLYEAIDKKDEAAKWRRELEKTQKKE